MLYLCDDWVLACYVKNESQSWIEFQSVHFLGVHQTIRCAFRYRLRSNIAAVVNLFIVYGRSHIDSGKKLCVLGKYSQPSYFSATLQCEPWILLTNQVYSENNCTANRNVEDTCKISCQEGYEFAAPPPNSKNKERTVRCKKEENSVFWSKNQVPACLGQFVHIKFLLSILQLRCSLSFLYSYQYIWQNSQSIRERFGQSTDVD